MSKRLLKYYSLNYYGGLARDSVIFIAQCTFYVVYEGVCSWLVDDSGVNL